MKAEIARFHCPEVDDLATYQPQDPEFVGFLLQVMAGPAGSGGEESFDVVVCTPSWFLDRYEEEVVCVGQTILITRFDWPAIERSVRAVVDRVSGVDWRDVAMQLDRVLGRWEFAGYTS